MKKILQTFFLLCMISSVSFAQQRQVTSPDERAKLQKVESIKSCPELYEQLTKLYGENFNLEDKQVLATLKNNIADINASEGTRKMSLYLVYGEKYLENKHLIGQSTK